MTTDSKAFSCIEVDYFHAFDTRGFILLSVPAFSNNQLPQKSTVFLKYDWRLFINGTTPAVWNFGTEISELQFCQSGRKYVLLVGCHAMQCLLKISKRNWLNFPENWTLCVKSDSIWHYNKGINLNILKKVQCILLYLIIITNFNTMIYHLLSRV